MIKRITFGLMSFLFVTNSFATANSGPTCEGVDCFSQVKMVPVDPQIIKDAPKVAWLTSNSGKGWAFGGAGRSSSADSSSGDTWFMSVPSKGPANSKGTFVFYPRKSTFAAYDSMGNLVTSGRASGGMAYCPDINRSCQTPVGTFRVQTKGDVDCVSNTYPIGEGGAAMPYCMFFGKGYAIHGSDYVPSFPASHGCIRLQPSTALWLRDNFMQIGTVVKVYSY